MTALADERAAQPALPGHVRLTRRGRLVLTTLFVLLAFAALTTLGARSAAVPTDAGFQPTRTVIVQPGQTLWDIAARATPTADPRDTIEQIVRLNALDSAGDLRVGQQIAVPTDG
jgi:predicted Zn-dependent protease